MKAGCGAVLGPNIELRPIDLDSPPNEETGDMLRLLASAQYEKGQAFHVLLDGVDIGEVGKLKVYFVDRKPWASTISLNDYRSENRQFWRVSGEGDSPDDAIFDALFSIKRQMAVAFLEADERFEQFTGRAVVTAPVT